MALPKLNQAYGYELQFFTNHAGHFILVMPSIGMFNALTVATVARTEAGRLGSSHATGVVRPFTEAQAARAFSKVRAAAITWAPRNVSTRKDSARSRNCSPLGDTICHPEKDLP